MYFFYTFYNYFIPFPVSNVFIVNYEKPNSFLSFRPSNNKVQYKVSHVGTEATVWEDRRLPTPVPRSDL